jgi:hypothetical protein
MVLSKRKHYAVTTAQHAELETRVCGISKLWDGHKERLPVALAASI